MPALYPIAADYPIVSEKYTLLDTDAQREEVNIAAEKLLRLKAPAYEGTIATTLIYCVVRQINFLMEQDLEPMILKSIMNDNPGNSTQYRDRFVDPAAMDLADDALDRHPVRFRPPGRGA